MIRLMCEIVPIINITKAEAPPVTTTHTTGGNHTLNISTYLFAPELTWNMPAA
ncbi:MAG TPA: hypothetical protein GXZ76_02905 [Clostridiaceae bacterium]|nr:hypothetical protein [Clostridiaceae bacterium]